MKVISVEGDPYRLLRYVLYFAVKQVLSLLGVSALSDIIKDTVVKGGSGSEQDIPSGFLPKFRINKQHIAAFIVVIIVFSLGGMIFHRSTKPGLNSDQDSSPGSSGRGSDQREELPHPHELRRDFDEDGRPAASDPMPVQRTDRTRSAHPLEHDSGNDTHNTLIGTGDGAQDPGVSDARADVIRETAGAWRRHRRFKLPDIDLALDGLTQSETQDLIRNGLAVDLGDLQAAKKLTEWMQRGFKTETPTYLYTDSPELADIRMVSDIREMIGGSLHLVSEQSAALFIQISKSESNYVTENSGNADGPLGYAGCRITIRWINGRSLPSAPIVIYRRSTDMHGPGSMDANVQANATTDAVRDATESILRLVR